MDGMRTLWSTAKCRPIIKKVSEWTSNAHENNSDNVPWSTRPMPIQLNLCHFGISGNVYSSRSLGDSRYINLINIFLLRTKKTYKTPLKTVAHLREDGVGNESCEETSEWYWPENQPSDVHFVAVRKPLPSDLHWLYYPIWIWHCCLLCTAKDSQVVLTVVTNHAAADEAVRAMFWGKSKIWQSEIYHIWPRL